MKVTAQATRSGGWWAVEVPDVPGAFTQVKRLDQVADAAAEAVADLLNVDIRDVEVEVLPVLAPELRNIVQAAREAAADAAAAQAKASAAMRLAVAVIRAQAKFTARDAAAVLGISHQRVGQLEHGAKEAVRKSAKDVPFGGAPVPVKRVAPTPVKRVAPTRKKSGVYVTKAAAAKGGRTMGRPAAQKRSASKG